MIEQVNVPTSAADVVTALRSEATAVLAGGTLLMPTVNNEATDIKTLVSTRRIDNATIAADGDRIRIGAAVTLTQLAASDLVGFLHPALSLIASPLIRNLATVGGNLFADQPYGDLGVCLLALDASVEVLGADGSDVRPVADVIDDGVAPGQLVTAVSFDRPADGCWFFEKAMRRKLNSAAIVTVAAVLGFEGDIISAARIGLGGCGPKGRRAPAAEQAMVGSSLTAATVDGAAAAAEGDAACFTDEYASAWYRQRVLPVHIRRAFLGENQ